MEQINQVLENIVLFRNQISELKNSDSSFNSLSKKLQEAEQQFTTHYSTQLHEILLDVHDELCPDNDVESPLKYIASQYHISKDGSANSYFVDPSEGLQVHMDDYPNKPTRLVLLPNPFRVVLNIDEFNKEEVWNSETSSTIYH